MKILWAVALQILILYNILEMSSAGRVKFWLKQAFNVPALRQLGLALRNPHLLVPTYNVRSISDLDPAALKSSGVRYIVFDKDNTLATPYANELHPSLAKAMSAFRSNYQNKNMAILSNSAGCKDDDVGYKGAEAAERGIGVPVIRHVHKKPDPDCLQEVLAHFSLTSIADNDSNNESSRSSSSIKPEQICIIGDRLLTDVIFGNLSGMHTAFVAPITLKKDHPIAVIIRFIERIAILPVARRLTKTRKEGRKDGTCI